MKNGKNRKLFIRLLPLILILTATIGQGLADIAFTDFVPVRPYSAAFRFTPIEMIGRFSIMGDVLIVSLVIVLIASLLVALANRTTGIVIAHSGGPAVNLNLSGSPGTTSVIPLLPLFFAFIGLVFVAVRLKREEAGI